ncbi:hypothetical protein [Thermodesulfatator autotrophicus]|uniref:Uncharacterized protein n=1 Tax=Thermodesulfatator autotrophicus TaxID=1795632 RepID=A0A177EAB1_9BACT|nr:hypothetical protein [Thermodesulfatator autotrophicus]OAG28738.1 hypothetical protein TH606_00290 [Thermodesulfatator autotrophicus]
MSKFSEQIEEKLASWEESLASQAKELEIWADKAEEEGQPKLAAKLREAALLAGSARLKLAEARVIKESGSLAEELALCAVCAWRETCQKRFTRDTGSPFRCPDFTRDVTLKP